MFNTCVHIKCMHMLILQYSFKTLLYTSVSYCMVCAPVRDDNPRALASGLSPVQTQKYTITYLFTSMHLHFVHCEIFYDIYIFKAIL